MKASIKAAIKVTTKVTTKVTVQINTLLASTVSRISRTPKALLTRTMSVIVVVITAASITGCASYNYPEQVQLGDKMISVSGESLDGKKVNIPEDFVGEKTLLLFGFIHKSQFDIDRWLIGLDMTDTRVNIYEIPTLKGVFPQLFSRFIDDAMREGIPKEIWRDVVTVYQDGDEVQTFTGNQNPKNARVMLLDENGRVLHFYNRGFSVDALKALRKHL